MIKDVTTTGTAEPSTPSEALTLADIFGALAVEEMIPCSCPHHGERTHTLMFRRGSAQLAVFSCECVWNIPERTWRHED